jgi:hypothetical protein
MRLRAGDKLFLLMPIQRVEGRSVIVTILQIGVDPHGQPMTASIGRSESVEMSA